MGTWGNPKIKNLKEWYEETYRKELIGHTDKQAQNKTLVD